MIPSILDFDDYRAFLRDLYAARKRARAGYSYRKFASDLGFSPSNFLHLVVSGKRNLSRDAVETIKKNVKWTAQQRKYFQNLVLLDQEESDAARTGYRAELDKILGRSRKTLNPDHEAYFSKWYVPVIREIVALKDFVPDLGWIAHKLDGRIDRVLAREALQILVRLGMLVKRGKTWVQSDEHLATPSEITSDMIHDYHREMLKLSLSSLDLAPEKRDVSAMTMSLTPVQFEWLKQRVVDFRDELQQELQGMDSGDHTLVAQLNIQLFPVTSG